jgi:hypothetical protein
MAGSKYYKTPFVYVPPIDRIWGLSEEEQLEVLAKYKEEEDERIKAEAESGADDEDNQLYGEALRKWLQ